MRLKLIKTIIDEYHEYSVDKLIVYNWHESNSNEFYKYLGGKVIKQLTQCTKDQETLVDVFIWNIGDINTKLTKMLYSRGLKQGGFQV